MDEAVECLPNQHEWVGDYTGFHALCLNCNASPGAVISDLLADKKALLLALREIRDGEEGAACGHSCVLGKVRGQGTNGACKCSPDPVPRRALLRHRQISSRAIAAIDRKGL